jgi:hypothetical protein
MPSIFAQTARRHSVRREIKTPCWAVSMDGGRLVGDSLVDLSPEGMLLNCMLEVSVGDEVFVIFKAPGTDHLWMRADTQVARVVEGRRQQDFIYGAGLKITQLTAISYNELSRRLVGFPPPIPRRGARVDYARIVRRIAGRQTPTAIEP